MSILTSIFLIPTEKGVVVDLVIKVKSIQKLYVSTVSTVAVGYGILADSRITKTGEVIFHYHFGKSIKCIFSKKNPH